MRDENCKFSLTIEEATKIKDAFSRIKYDPYGGAEFIFNIRKTAYEAFPVWMLYLLENQKASLHPLSHILINNFMLDDNITGSPLSHQTGATYKSGTISENILAAIGVVVGEPYSIKYIGNELVHNIVPHKEASKEYSALGYDVELDFHIEGGALKSINEDSYSPISLVLLGIRSDLNSVGPKTFISDARKAIKLLSQDDIDVLYGKNFTRKWPQQWGVGNRADVNIPCSMLSGNIDLPMVNAVFVTDLVSSLGKNAQTAFENFHNAIKKVSEAFYINPGTLLYIDNRFTLHAREKFDATFDPNGLGYRWLQRLYIAPNLWSFRSLNQDGERIFTPKEL